MAAVPLPFPRGLEAGINRGTDVNKRFALYDLGNTLSNGAFGGAPSTKDVAQRIRQKFGSHERESGPIFSSVWNVVLTSILAFRFDVTE